MGESDPPRPSPNDAAAPVRTAGSWWRQVLSQYFVPTAIASLVATVLSIYATITTAHEKQQEYNQKFEQLVDSVSIEQAFGGVYVPNPKAGRYALDRTKASFTQSVREQQATAVLLSLQAVAESETQRRTVLLIGGRLLNADPSNVATGMDAARLLTILIDQADRGRRSWNPFERSLNARLWQTVTSPSFMDLVTAGYENNYYNDDTTNHDLRPYWPTLNGDAPISHDAKFEVLWELTPPQYEGWVHLATFAYTFPQSVPRAKAGAPRGSEEPPTSVATARDLIHDLDDVALRHDLSDVGSVQAQYAIPDPRASPAQDPVLVASQQVDRSRFPERLIMLKHRLLRVRPPVEYFTPDGAFRKGSLGRIMGVVPAGSCITVVEPMMPVLVFLPSYIVADRPPPTAGTPVQFTGLVHMWAHVRAFKNDEDCLATAQ